jgi:hypothetical protein
MSNKLQPGGLGYLILDNYPGISIRVQFAGSVSGVDYYEIPKSDVGTTGINTTINGQPAGTYLHVEINASHEVFAYDPTGKLRPMYLGKGSV